MATDESANGASTHAGIITELSAWPPGTLYNVEALCNIFQRSPDTIARWVDEKGWLPPPAKVFGGQYWTNDQILEHVRKLLEAAQRDQDEKTRKIWRLASS